MTTSNKIHLGWGRCATSSLQVNCFDKLEYFANIGRPYKNDFINIRKGLRGEYFPLNYKKIKKEIQKISKKKIILSDETIGNAIFQNEKIFDLIKLIFTKDNTKVLFTIRNQSDWIVSDYKSDGRILKNTFKKYNNKIINFDDYFSFYYNGFNKTKNIFSHINYSSVIQEFSKYYDKIYILPIELLKNSNLYFEILSDFLYESKNYSEDLKKLFEVKKINASSSHRNHIYRIFRENFFPNFHPTKYFGKSGKYLNQKFKKFLDSGSEIKITLDSVKRNQIKEMYREGNIWLEEKFKINLKNLGYY